MTKADDGAPPDKYAPPLIILKQAQLKQVQGLIIIKLKHVSVPHNVRACQRSSPSVLTGIQNKTK